MTPFGESIQKLLSAYADVLLHTENLPRLGRVSVKSLRRIPDMPVEVQRLPLELLDKFGKAKTRWVSRQFTRLYVQSHVRKQLLAIARLAVWRAQATPDTREELESIAVRLKSFTDKLHGWGGLLAGFASLPVVSALLPAISAAVVGVIAGTESAKHLSALPRFALVIGVLALGALVMVWLPSISLGFRPKRALFAGGRVPDVKPSLDFDKREVQLVEITVTWDPARFPSTNVYQLENDVFDLLGVAKRCEVPVDVIVTTAVKGYMTIALILAYGVYFLLQGSGSRSWVAWVIGVLGFLALVFAQFGYEILLSIGEIRGSFARQRRREGLS